jgi:hypothetical protein
MSKSKMLRVGLEGFTLWLRRSESVKVNWLKSHHLGIHVMFLVPPSRDSCNVSRWCFSNVELSYLQNASWLSVSCLPSCVAVNTFVVPPIPSRRSCRAQKISCSSITSAIDRGSPPLICCTRRGYVYLRHANASHAILLVLGGRVGTSCRAYRLYISSCLTKIPRSSLSFLCCSVPLADVQAHLSVLTRR